MFFRLYESPRFLAATGRHEDALVSLQRINKFNGGDLMLDISDVCDKQSPNVNVSLLEPAPTLATTESSSRLSYDATGDLLQPFVANSVGLRVRSHHARSTSGVTTASTLHRTPRVLRPLPSFMRRPLLEAHDQLAETLTPEWRGTTLLVWAVWLLMAFGLSSPPPAFLQCH